jgi:hypothetical protein
MSVTIVKKEDIYKFLESLRKLGINAYILQWANNTGSDFIIFEKEIIQSHIKFDVRVESLDSYTKSMLSEYTIISNTSFKKQVQI